TKDFRRRDRRRQLENLRRRRHRLIEIGEARRRAVARHHAEHLHVAHAGLRARAFQCAFDAPGHGDHPSSRLIGSGGTNPMVRWPSWMMALGVAPLADGADAAMPAWRSLASDWAWSIVVSPGLRMMMPTHHQGGRTKPNGKPGGTCSLCWSRTFATDFFAASVICV